MTCIRKQTFAGQSGPRGTEGAPSAVYAYDAGVRLRLLCAAFAIVSLAACGSGDGSGTRPTIPADASVTRQTLPPEADAGASPADTQPPEELPAETAPAEIAPAETAPPEKGRVRGIGLSVEPAHRKAGSGSATGGSGAGSGR